MSHYLLFVPGVTANGDQALHDVGMGDLLKDGGAEWSALTGRGPGGKTGAIGTWNKGNEHDPRMGYFPNEQTWIPATEDKSQGLAAGRYWFGIEKDRIPTPHDIERRKQYAGGIVMLTDDNEWLIPAAAQLPHRFDINTNGEMQRVVKDEYKSFYDRADRYMIEIFNVLDLRNVLMEKRPDIELDPTPVPIVLKDGVQFCIDALALNYRLNAEVVAHLQLLDDIGLIRIIANVIELPQIVECEQQKKSLEPVSIPVG